jgi:hypothetical protein
MPIITDAEHDNMKIEAEYRVNRLFDEYRIRAQGDRLQGVRKEDGDQREIRNPVRSDAGYGVGEQTIPSPPTVVRPTPSGG